MFKKSWELTLFLPLVFSVFAPLFGFANKNVPDQNWILLERKPFKLIFSQKDQKDLALALETELQNAYRLLTQRLEWEVSSPIYVVIRDDRDSGDAFSDNFPWNRITIYAAPFDQLSTLRDDPNWIRSIAYHELAHIVLNDMAKGFFRGARAVFGSIALPNRYLPPWFAEGFAVWVEGRGRTKAFQEILMGPVNPGQWNRGRCDWPDDRAAYAFGYELFRQLEKEKGEAEVWNWVKNQGRELPIFWNNPRENEWKNWLREKKSVSSEESSSQLEKLVDGFADPPSIQVIQKDPLEFYFLGRSRLNGMGLFHWVRGGFRRIWEWYLPHSPRLEKVRNDYLIYSRQTEEDPFRISYEVFVWDIQLEKEFQITQGARAQSVWASDSFKMKDGKWVEGEIQFVRTLSSGKQVRVSRSPDHEKVLVESQGFQPVESIQSHSDLEPKVGPGGWGIVKTNHPKHPKVSEETKSKKVTSKVDAEEIETSDYKPWSTLFPRYWMPWGQVVTGGYLLGIATRGMDVLETHSLGGHLLWDSRAPFPSYQIFYQFDGWFPTIRLEMNQENRYLGAFRSSNRSEISQILLEYPLTPWRLSFGGMWSTSRFLDQQDSSGGISVQFDVQQKKARELSLEPSLGERGTYAMIRAGGNFIGDEEFSSFEARWDQRLGFPRSDSSFIRWNLTGGISTNRDLATHYYVGGGEETIHRDGEYLLRGFLPGVLYGRQVFTANFEFWIRLKTIFSGLDVKPLFFEQWKARVFVDTGSAEYFGTRKINFQTWPVGTGLQFMLDTEWFYHFPLTMALGIHYGIPREGQGEWQLVLGLIGQDGWIQK